MDSTNVAGIILEGIAGTGKTTALAKLLQHQAWVSRPYLSSVVLSEHQTLRVLEPKQASGTLALPDSLHLLDTHLTYLQGLSAHLNETTWLERDRSAQKLPFIFERFHLSHAYHYDHVQWEDIAPIDARLAALHATIYLFTIEEADIQSRTIDDYTKSGWRSYLDTLGPNNETIQRYFVRKQQYMLDLAAKSALPVIHLDSSHMTTDEIVQRIVATWPFSQ